MELDEIKRNWKQLSDRLERQDILNRQILINMLNKNTRSSLNKLERFEYMFLVFSVIFSLFVVMFLHLTPVDVYSRETLFLMLIIFVSAAIWQCYKLFLLKKIENPNNTIIETLEYTLRFKFVTKARFIAGMVLSVPILALLFYFQREIFKDELLWGAIVGAVIGLAIGVKATMTHWRNINTFLSDLRELKSYQKEE